MRKISTNITLDPNLKKKSTTLLKKMGLDLSTAVTLFLNEMIIEQGLPFPVRVKEEPNDETLAAFAEEEQMLHNPKKYKVYKSVKELAAEYE